MAKAKFFADTNVPIQIVRGLRGLGYDVETVQRVEGTSEPNSPMEDESVLGYATTHRRTVITLNCKHFKKLHEELIGHYGIILCRTDDEEAKRAKEIDSLAKANKSLQRQLFVVPPFSEAEIQQQERRRNISATQS